MEDLSFKNLSNQPGQSLLRTQVYEYLRNELKAENLKPGMFISMNLVMKNLGISRTPLRDALLQLQTEGDVVIDIHMREKDLILKYIPNISLFRWQMLTAGPINPYFSALGLIESC